MFGHDDVAHQRESVAVTRFAENMDEGVSGAHRAQKGKSPIASEGDEMEMAVSVMANKFVSNRKKEKSNPRPSKSGRVGHPEVQRPGKCKGKCLVDDVREWYYSAETKCQLKKHRKGAPPAETLVIPWTSTRDTGSNPKPVSSGCVR